MSTARTCAHLAAALVASATVLVATATHSEAQRVIQGFHRVDQSDVTGPAVTSGDQVAGLFEPGTVPSMVCPVAWGVRTASVRVEDQLRSGSLDAAFAGLDVEPVVQRRVADLLTNAPDADAAEAEIIAALTANNDSPDARRAARRLVRRLRGLLVTTQRVNPERPGSEAAVRLTESVGAYNELVDESRPEFLAAPPAEFVAVHAALNQLILAALENQGRPTDLGARDAQGLACAAALPPVAPAPPPPLERAMEICVLSGDRFQTVAAVFRPQTGDTLVIVAGERRPFGEVYPVDQYASGKRWFIEREPITVAGRTYEHYGLAGTARPEEMVRVAEYDGIALYTRRGESTPPETLFIPAGPACEVQQYRASAAIRRVRG